MQQEEQRKVDKSNDLAFDVDGNTVTESELKNVNENRTKRTLNNAIFNLIYYIAQIVLKFVIQAVFVNVLSKEYLGINGLYTNILTLLSVAELGIGNAIVFSMYKPISENDIEKINRLFTLYKKMYLIIILIISVLGFGLLPFLPYLIESGTEVLNVNIYIVYIIFLVNSILGYFIAHRRSLIFAYQRNDVESKVSTVRLIILNILQLLSLILFKSYYIYIILYPISTIIESISVYFISKKMFPNIHIVKGKLDNATQKEVKTNIIALIFHKFGGAIVYATDNILISAILGLAILGTYSNYALIITSLITIFNFASTSVRSGLGNYIATNRVENTYTMFKNFNFVLMWAVGFSCASLLCLYQDFITLWLGSDYLLDYNIVILIVISFYLNVSKNMTNLFKECTGHLKEDQYRPIFESLINLGVSIGLGYVMGISGVIIGTIVSTILGPLWTEPYVLYKYYFKKNVFLYVIEYFKYLLSNTIAIFLTYLSCYFIPIIGVWGFIIKCVICIIVPNLFILLAFIRTDELKYMKDKLRKVLRRRKI